MIVRNAIDNFKIVVGRSVRMLLTRERKNDASIIAARGREFVGLPPYGDFQARPFAPQIDVGGGFDDVGDVGAADAGGDFDEIEFAATLGFQKFSFRATAEESPNFNEL